MVLPANASAGPDLVTLRSAERVTAVVASSLSLASLGSAVVFVLTLASLVRSPGTKLELILTVIVQVTWLPAVRPALVQVTVPAALAQSGVVAETKLVPAGRTSSTLKPTLSDGPSLSTRTV